MVHDLEAMVYDLRKALEPLYKVGQAFFDNQLDEARPEWGDKPADAGDVIMVCDRDGQSLVTLAECFRARVAYRETPSDLSVPPLDPTPEEALGILVELKDSGLVSVDWDDSQKCWRCKWSSGLLTFRGRGPTPQAAIGQCNKARKALT